MKTLCCLMPRQLNASCDTEAPQKNTSYTVLGYAGCVFSYCLLTEGKLMLKSLTCEYKNHFM